MRELAVQASSDTATSADRAALNTEVVALETEIDRIGSTTTWGGIQILDGTYSEGAPIVFQIGTRSGDTMSFSLGHLVTTTASGTAEGNLQITQSLDGPSECFSLYIGTFSKDDYNSFHKEGAILERL